MPRYSTKQILKEAAVWLLVAALIEGLVVLILLGFDQQAAHIARQSFAKRQDAALMTASSAKNACASAAIPSRELPKAEQ